MRAVYGSAAQEVLRLEASAGKNDTQKRLVRIDSMERQWDNIRSQLQPLPSAQELRTLLESVGCPCTPEEIGVDDTLLRQTIRCVKELRPRYTLLQTIWDLDLSDELAERVIRRLHEK